MPYSRRWNWLKAVTGEGTVRGMARECGVSHTTIQRWLRGELPAGTLTKLMVKFDADPIEASVVWGFLDDASVAKLNWDAMVKYIPVAVLAEEMHRRAAGYSQTRPDTMRKTSAFERPEEADADDRTSFRLTSKM
jgi:hypothetical protein